MTKTSDGAGKDSRENIMYKRVIIGCYWFICQPFSRLGHSSIYSETFLFKCPHYQSNRFCMSCFVQKHTPSLTSLSLRSVLFPSTMKGKSDGSWGSPWIRNSFLQPSRAEKLALDVTSNTSMQQWAPLYRGVPRDWNLSVPAVSQIWGRNRC